MNKEEKNQQILRYESLKDIKKIPVLGPSRDIVRDSKAAEDLFPIKEPIISDSARMFNPRYEQEINTINTRLSNIEQTLGRLVIQCESSKLLTPLIPIPENNDCAIDHNTFKLYSENVNLREVIADLRATIQGLKLCNSDLNNNIKAKDAQIKALLLEIAQQEINRDKNELQS